MPKSTDVPEGCDLGLQNNVHKPDRKANTSKLPFKWPCNAMMSYYRQHVFSQYAYAKMKVDPSLVQYTPPCPPQATQQSSLS